MLVSISLLCVAAQVSEEFFYSAFDCVQYDLMQIWPFVLHVIRLHGLKRMCRMLFCIINCEKIGVGLLCVKVSRVHICDLVIQEWIYSC